MPEHLIRFRAGWEPLDDPSGKLSRPFALPSREFPLTRGERSRIGRWFQAPRLDPHAESLWLRLDCVTGLDAVFLNHHEIARGPFAESPEIVRLDMPLLARNHLVLEVFPRDDAEISNASLPWGEVALLIRREER